MDHMVLLAQLPNEVICSILRSITVGLSAWDTAVCTNCCTTLDHIVTFVWCVFLLTSSINIIHFLLKASME